MIRHLISAALLATTLAAPATADAGLKTSAAIVDGLDALQGQVDLWPGFDPWSIPVAVFDGEHTWLFRHPSPPEGFEAVPGRDGVQVLAGRPAALVANSSAEIGGVTTATLMLASMRGEKELPLARRVGTLVHETFHVFQGAHHPQWRANEASLFLYPTDDADGLAGRRLEEAALRRALGAAEPETSACWTRAALAARRERFAALDEDLVAYEHGTELNEGLASYVEHRSRGETRGERLFEEPSAAEKVRQRAYGTGTALGLLLDRFDAGWRERLEADDTQALDEMLAAAVGEGDACKHADDEREALVEAAHRDAAAVVTTRLEAVREFKEKTGWRVVVTAPAQPLLLCGFDPLNVMNVGEGEVLHNRFLCLKNDAGELGVMGRQSFSTAAGPHPVFTGVRTLTLTGLPEPEVEDDGERVKISTAGFDADFAATLEKEGETLELRLRTE